jgi:hypothetical protein
MKKMLLAVLLSLAGVGLSNGKASAWLCHHCCNHCATICVRPYNAFTPSAFGTICADGCCPLQFGHCPPPPPWMMPPPWAGGCGPDGACGTCAVGAPHGGTAITGPAPGAPATLPPGATVPVMQSPAPVQLPVAPTTGAVGYPTGVQPTGYHPGYAPMPWVQPPAYPTYWNMPYPNGR